MRQIFQTLLALAVVSAAGAQTQPTTAPTAGTPMDDMHSQMQADQAQAPHPMPDQMGQAEMMALMQAMQEARLPDPGPDGFLTPAEEEAVRGYFESLMAIDAQIREVQDGQEVTSVTDEMVTQMVAGLSQVGTLQPPALQDAQANEALATFHTSLTQMATALAEFIQEMPRGEVTPEMHAGMVPAANAFQERMRGIMVPMMTSAQQVEQIVNTDLGDSPINDFAFGGLIN